MKTNDSEKINSFSIPINQHAPVVAQKTTLINSTPEDIISKLSDISKWSTWRKSIKWAHIDSTNTQARVGTTFIWKSGGLKYNSQIHTLSKNAFGWTGKTIGAYAVHNWLFTEINNQTRVDVVESLDGIAIKILHKQMNKNLPILLEEDLKELKLICEKRK